MEAFATPQRSARRRRPSTPPSCAACIGKPTRRAGTSPPSASVTRCNAAPPVPLPGAMPQPPRSIAICRRCISPISRSPAPARTGTIRRGSTSCARCGRRSTAPPTPSTRAAARANSPMRSTPISSASRPPVPNGTPCSATFTAGARWRPGCGPCSRSVTSTASAPDLATIRCPTTMPRRRWRRHRRESIRIARGCSRRCAARSPRRSTRWRHAIASGSRPTTPRS